MFAAVMRSARSPRWSLLACVCAAVGTLSCGKESSPEARHAERLRVATPLDVLPQDAPFAIHVDLRRLRAMGLGSAAPSIANEAKLTDRYGAWTRACGAAPVDSFHDVLVAMSESGLLIVAELGISQEQAMRCVRETFGGKDAFFQDRQVLRIGEGSARPLFVTTTQRLLLVGDETLLQAALDLAETPPPLRACLDLGESGFAAACGTPPQAAHLGEVRAKMQSRAGKLGVEARVAFADEQAAAAFRARVERAQKSVESEDDFVKKTAAAVRSSVSGSTALLGFEANGDDVAQVGALIALAAAARHALWEERAKELSAEARTETARIVAALKRIGESARPRGPAFPPSAPPVPREVPRGIAHDPESGEFSHPSWAELGFSLDKPFRYQYEVVVSADRRRAIVRARGDLDGNGRASLFETIVEAKPTGVVVSTPKVLEETE